MEEFWTNEDREALTGVTLGVLEMLPARDELVRRITTSYVPARVAAWYYDMREDRDRLQVLADALKRQQEES